MDLLSYFFGKMAGRAAKKREHDGKNVEDMLIDAIGAPIYADIYGGKGKHQYFDDDPIYIVLAQRDNWYLVRHHSLSDGITGWFKVSDVQPYNPYRNKYITIA